MSPDDISAKGTEHGLQAAVFVWAAIASRYGFSVANNMDVYSAEGIRKVLHSPFAGSILIQPVIALEWLHAIPNGGQRDARTAALLKAEGVRKGIADIFLPVPKRSYDYDCDVQLVDFCGLYIEMKTGIGKQSEDQIAFEIHCKNNDYQYVVCRTWREAAKAIQDYLT